MTTGSIRICPSPFFGVYHVIVVYWIVLLHYQLLSFLSMWQDVADVLAALDEVIQSGLADPAKIAVLGGSHGGFLASHLIGQVSHFSSFTLTTCFPFLNRRVIIPWLCVYRHQTNFKQAFWEVQSVIFPPWLASPTYLTGAILKPVEKTLLGRTLKHLLQMTSVCFIIAHPSPICQRFVHGLPVTVQKIWSTSLQIRKLSGKLFLQCWKLQTLVIVALNMVDMRC